MNRHPSTFRWDSFARGAYGDYRRYDFFVRHPLGVEPPQWAKVAEATAAQTPAPTP